jgi:hypothetical protein
MSVSKLRWAVRIRLCVCLLLWTVASARAQLRDPDAGYMRGEALPCGSTRDWIPTGLAVLFPSGDYQNMNLHVLNNPFISGVAVQINWRDIEPFPGQPDWSKLDALFSAAESARKWVHLIVFPGFFSPAWALEGAQTDLFKIQYGPGHGAVARLPMPWDRVYLDRWFAFMKRVSQKYGASPAFRMIAAAGPTSVSVEMTLPSAPPAIWRWLIDSYTPVKYLGAWEEVFHFYAATFPNQCISLAAPGLPILAQGKRDHQRHLRRRVEIVNQAMRVLRNRLAIQSSNLHAGQAPVEAPDATGFINSYTGRIITGFEMRSGSQSPVASKVMGAEGDPPLALRRSIDKGMAPNNSGRYVDYVEIHEADVIRNFRFNADLRRNQPASPWRQLHPGLGRDAVALLCRNLGLRKVKAIFGFEAGLGGAPTDHRVGVDAGQQVSRPT